MNDITYTKYVAVQDTSAFGFNDDGQLIVGLRLIPLDSEAHDVLADEYSNVGADMELIMPERPVVAGDVVKVQVCNLSKDWETGFVDSYDLRLTVEEVK